METNGGEAGMAKGPSTKAVKTTAEEQEALLQKVQNIKQAAFAKREAEGNTDPEITANYMDFSKPMDDAAN